MQSGEYRVAAREVFREVQPDGRTMVKPAVGWECHLIDSAGKAMCSLKHYPQIRLLPVDPIITWDLMAIGQACPECTTFTNNGEGWPADE